MMSTQSIQTFGSFLENLPPSDEYLTLNFSPTSAPRKRRWNNYGLSADFLGDYFASFFPGNEMPDSKINRQDTVKGAVSYIANELLENAVKYSDEAINLPISIMLHLYEDAIIFQITNYARLPVVEKYQAFIQELLKADLDEFYTQQLEKTALGTGESNMGLLTMISDYGAQFGWQFQMLVDNPAAIRVSVTVQLKV